MKKIKVKEVKQPDDRLIKFIKDKRYDEINEKVKQLNKNSLYDKLEHRKLMLELESIKNNTRLELRERYEKDGYVFVSNELTPYGKCIKVQETLRRSDLKHVIDRNTFEMFDPYTDKLKEALKKAQNYSKEPTGFITFLGNSRVGKTHLSIAIARELILQGKEIEYVKWVDLMSELSSLTYSQREKRIGEIKKEPVLIIDDLFWVEHQQGQMSEVYQYEKDYAMTIIEYRKERNLPTIITTNRTTKELHYISAGIASRIYEASGDNYIVINEKNYNEIIKGRL